MILLDILDFDFILGMDWLASHCNVLDCYVKIVALVILEMSLVVWRGSVSQAPMGIISYIQGQRLISIGCSTYFSHLSKVIDKTFVVESLPFVCVFPDVIPVDLPRLPPEREVICDRG